MRIFLPFLFFIFLQSPCLAWSENTNVSPPFNFSEDEFTVDQMHVRPNPLRQVFFAKKQKNKKITAAILAFPLPFGIVGLHRIYMGCAPFIPVVYIGSLGGAFGILPLIDFFVILKTEDISKFNNSTEVFMWVE